MEGRRSAFFGIRYSHQRQAQQRNSRRCCRHGGGAAICEGECGRSSRTRCPGQGDFSLCGEGPSAFARTTSPHPSTRSPGQRNILITSSMALLHTPCREYPSGPRSLIAHAAPCPADRVTFATTSDFLASSPIDVLQAGRGSRSSSPSRSRRRCTSAHKKSASASAQLSACDGPACVHVRCTVRRVGGATHVPACFRDNPPWMYMSVRCRR